ncbi:MAG: HAD family hydrolase [Proteobacteria bacterium]|nr:HAD family hydrolase [Pseudomonadota bacterium]
MSAIEIIVFDCDGVLLDSVAIKTETFGRLFKDLGSEAVDYVKSYHLKHGGVSRYAKFEHYFEKFHGRAISDDESRALDREFNRLALEQLLVTPMLPGVREFLTAHKDTWPLYVASGAPDYELKVILNKMGLDKYFKGVFGSPTPKTQLLAAIVAAEQADPRRVLMIGDSGTDLEAARAVGTRFLGVGEFPAPIAWMPDLTGLYEHVQSL